MNEYFDWKNVSYLRTGNQRQQRAYAVLEELALLTSLGMFAPIVVGTIPIDIDLPESDIDIICEVYSEKWEAFRQLLQEQYGHWPAFKLREVVVGEQASLVCCFFYKQEQVEVFGQARPTIQQYAYRHLVVEHAVLEVGGEKWRSAVRQLKQQGLKTEPAFATLLQLSGDPYEAMLLLESMSREELLTYVIKCDV